MRFQIRNIGAIGTADIEIDGITIIAGENNVGKSTVGKSLYAFLHDMSSWKKTYDDVCSAKLEQFLYQNSSVLEDWCMKISGAKRRRTSKADQLQKSYARKEDFLVAIEDYQIAEDEGGQNEAEKTVRELLEGYCHDYLSLYSYNNIDQLWTESYDVVRDWIRQVLEEVKNLELDELKLQMKKIKQSFQEVFNSQYRKIGSMESRVTLTDDGGRSVTFLAGSEREELDSPVRVSNRVFFIESPKIYDYLSNTRYGHVQKEYLRYLMSPNIFKQGNTYYRAPEEEYTTGQENSSDFLQEISLRLAEVMGGRAEFLQKVGLEFKDRFISEPIHAVNVSTGLKSIALLEYALRIAAIEEGDILILDEPEINLHPEWQVVYAKTLVDLQRLFHLKIVITTHSPYFMRAIECFTDVNGSMDYLDVYRVSRNREAGEIQVENVSYTEYGMTDLYDELSAPLEELEALLEEAENRGDGSLR